MVFLKLCQGGVHMRKVFSMISFIVVSGVLMFVGLPTIFTSCSFSTKLSPIDDGQPYVVASVKHDGHLADMVENGEIPSDVASLSIFSDIYVNLSPIKDLTSLKYLNLNGCQIDDITPLKGLTNLKELNISTSDINNLSPLSDLVNLKRLSIGSQQGGNPSPAVIDLSPLSNLVNLEYLNLQYTPINDISALSGLTNLKELRLGSNGSKIDITPLKSLTRLEKLYLSDNQIDDITALKNLRNLTELKLINNQITDFSPLYGLKKLKILNIASNPGITEKQKKELQRHLSGFGCNGGCEIQFD